MEPNSFHLLCGHCGASFWYTQESAWDTELKNGSTIFTPVCTKCLPDSASPALSGDDNGD